MINIIDRLRFGVYLKKAALVRASDFAGHRLTACSRLQRSTAFTQIASASTLRQLRLHAERYVQP